MVVSPPTFARYLSPVGRGRFRLCRNRVRGSAQIEPNSRAIASSTPSRFSYTSLLATRMTWKPNDSSRWVRSTSRALADGEPWVAPSTSTINLPSSVTKSTTNRSMACWRRNFQCARRRLRSAYQRRASALVCVVRRRRDLCLNRCIPLTRPLRQERRTGRPLPTGERYSICLAAQ
jgi:hypothetical protein